MAGGWIGIAEGIRVGFHLKISKEFLPSEGFCTKEERANGRNGLTLVKADFDSSFMSCGMDQGAVGKELFCSNLLQRTRPLRESQEFAK